MVKVSNEQLNKLKEKWSHPLIVDEEEDEVTSTKEVTSTTPHPRLLAAKRRKIVPLSLAVVTPGETKGDFKENDNEAATAHASVQFDRNAKMEAVTPSKELTGVEESITEICGHAADKDEFISDVTTFLSLLQPLFETGCEKSCIHGLQSSGSEKILALDASNYEDMTLQFQNLLEKVHHYKLLKSAQLSKETESDGRVNNSMTAAVALTALNKFTQSQHQRTKKDQTKSTELKLSKQDHKEDRNMEINMPMSIPVSTFSHENQNPQSENCMQRRKLARQYTREQKKLQKQKGGGSLHAECMIYRHDNESEEDDDVNGETNDSSSAGDLSSRKRKLEDMTKTSTSQNVHEIRAM
uniref:Uncharacterized protein n=1 Tax=Chaetoceros debilis TaxID=122233 RepID=A0A7S3QFB4_9STRA